MSATTFLLSLAALGSGHSEPAIERWGVIEVTLPGPTSGNPYQDVQWSATFSQGDQHMTVPGFWDGGDTYRVRFSPPATGEWRYETRSATPELSGKTGTFTATAATGNNHGPVVVFDKFYLRYADGTPYHQWGTTCYAWVHQTRELQEQTLKTLAASPFNKIRFCVFPKHYDYNKNEPELFAFQKGADGQFDFNRPDPVFWQHFEQRILDLQKLGIEADLILWHPYDRWGFSEMSDAEDDRYLRYCIARLSAFRNVWWSLANEFDFMSNLDGKHPGRKTMDDWDRFFAILQQEDPHQRLRGIHNGAMWYDHAKAWVTHASLQTSDMNGGVRFREKYQKPVIYDECRYEGNIPQGWGNLDAKTMTQRFWLGSLSGCYVGHGETYKHADDILWWSKGGVLHGESPPRIQWLKDFLAQSPPFHELAPLGDGQGQFLLAKPGEFYLFYCLDARRHRIELAGSRPYKLDLVDPWEMTVTTIGTAPAGEFFVSAPRPDVAYRFTPYQPGERLRPEARITASVTEGTAPLDVTFTSPGGGRVRWDFGDGATSEESNPTHTFRQPGLYAVTLTVTDSEGLSSRAFYQIAVDRGTSEPLVRAGFATGEFPALKFHGTANRAEDGSLHLPGGAPWGWVEAGEGAIEDLRGLRSFTVMGWLKLESLEVGSGGNRIVFCLNESRSGIDLVCQADGRLRLAVNEWPDGIRNDSSPGKLQIGKWTFFAVTYDATRANENVSWYFSAPQEAPQKTPLTFDRKTTYNSGPVGTDIGPLAIGNFNPTMRGYGLDRQFRGAIRGLQLFGSRVSGRGALDQATLERLLSAGPASAQPSLAARSAPRLAAATASAENWPQFRGPTGQGISGETGLPVKWSETENIAWKTPIPYAGWSSPIVFGDRVFVTGTSEDGVSCHILCLDRVTGKILWDTEVLRQVPGVCDRRNSHATSTPATDGERVYAFFSSASAAAVTFDGKVAWTKRDIKFHAIYGLASSPMQYDDLLIMNFDGTDPETDDGHTRAWDKSYVLALDKATGKETWKARRGMSRVAYSTPIVVDAGGASQLITCAGDVIQALDPLTGGNIWWATHRGEGLVPSPVSGDGMVFATSAFPTNVPEGEAVRAFRLGGNGDVTKTHLAWSHRPGMSKIPSMVFANHALFQINESGVLTCMKGSSGEVLWRERLRGPFSASPVWADGKVHLLSETGKTTVVEDGPQFKVVAENDLDEKCCASPAVSQGQIFIRTENHLFAIGRRF
jgi:outer membrane protein assembly factor BamB